MRCIVQVTISLIFLLLIDLSCNGLEVEGKEAGKRKVKRRRNLAPFNFDSDSLFAAINSNGKNEQSDNDRTTPAPVPKRSSGIPERPPKLPLATTSKGPSASNVESPDNTPAGVNGGFFKVNYTQYVDIDVGEKLDGFEFKTPQTLEPYRGFQGTNNNPTQGTKSNKSSKKSSNSKKSSKSNSSDSGDDDDGKKPWKFWKGNEEIPKFYQAVTIYCHRDENGNYESVYAWIFDIRHLDHPGDYAGPCLDITPTQSPTTPPQPTAPPPPTPAPPDCLSTSGTCVSTFDGFVTELETVESGQTIAICDGTIITATAPLQLDQSSVTICCQGNGCSLQSSGADSNLLVYGDSVIIRDITFDNGLAPSGNNGGNVFIEANGDHVIDRCSFANGITEDSGLGANLFVATTSGTGTLQITGSTFQSGEAFYGGGLVAQDLTFVSIKNSNFIDNTGREGGGAIYANLLGASSAPTVLFENTLFEGNSASLAAGAIYIAGLAEGSQVSIINSDFIDHSGADVGGVGVFEDFIETFDLVLQGNTASGSDADICIDFFVQANTPAQYQCISADENGTF